LRLNSIKTQFIAKIQIKLDLTQFLANFLSKSMKINQNPDQFLCYPLKEFSQYLPEISPFLAIFERKSAIFNLFWPNIAQN